jgi:hypothetical protein
MTSNSNVTLATIEGIMLPIDVGIFTLEGGLLTKEVLITRLENIDGTYIIANIPFWQWFGVPQ